MLMSNLFKKYTPSRSGAGNAQLYYRQGATWKVEYCCSSPVAPSNLVSFSMNNYVFMDQQPTRHMSISSRLKARKLPDKEIVSQMVKQNEQFKKAQKDVQSKDTTANNISHPSTSTSSSTSTSNSKPEDIKATGVGTSAHRTTSTTTASASILRQSVEPSRSGDTKTPTSTVVVPSILHLPVTYNTLEDIPAFSKPNQGASDIFRHVTHTVKQPEMPKTLHIALVGAANVGKSTLVNRLVGEKVSVVSPKAQTTRDQVLGVYTKDNIQLVFFDTPGIVPVEDAKDVQKELIISAWNTIQECDIDAQNRINRHIHEMLTRLKSETTSEKPVVLVMNKIDKVEDKPSLETLREQFNSICKFDEHFLTSALRYRGLSDLQVISFVIVYNLNKDFLLNKALPRPWKFDNGVKTDQAVVHMINELVREKFFRRLDKEIPYILKVENTSVTELPNGDMFIEETVYVPKSSQKKIVVGSQGAVVKGVRTAVTNDLIRMFNKTVHLNIIVRVKKPTSSMTQ